MIIWTEYIVPLLTILQSPNVLDVFMVTIISVNDKVRSVLKMTLRLAMFWLIFKYISEVNSHV